MERSLDVPDYALNLVVVFGYMLSVEHSTSLRQILLRNNPAIAECSQEPAERQEEQNIVSRYGDCIAPVLYEPGPEPNLVVDQDELTIDGLYEHQRRHREKHDEQGQQSPSGETSLPHRKECDNRQRHEVDEIVNARYQRPVHIGQRERAKDQNDRRHSNALSSTTRGRHLL